MVNFSPFPQFYMLFCSLAVSAVMLTSKPAPFHSVQYYDDTSRVSQRDLDRSYCPLIVMRTPKVAPDGTTYTDAHVAAVQAMYQHAVAQHCQLRFAVDKLPNGAGECGEGFAKNGRIN